MTIFKTHPAICYIAITSVLIICSAINAFDPVIWWLEAAPVFIGLFAMGITYKYFQLTRITYVFILIHFAILLLGAHYTYAHVPLFDMLDETFSWGRNNYDKVGHFAQGFIPAMIAREIIIRRNVLTRQRGWLFFFVTCICLSISALYELIEWWVAVAMKSVEDDFLGTQGYVWDTQSDMLCALIGAMVMQWTLAKIQDKQIVYRQQQIATT